MSQENITILIKTFKRPTLCQRLINSIREFYPYIKIFVAVDDGDGVSFANIDQQIEMPFNSGLSAGRNLLVDKCETEYCVILDDDCIFTKETDLEKALKELQERDLDILQFKGETYFGTYIVGDDEVRMSLNDRVGGLYDFCANIFLAKTNSLKQFKWDESLKTGEHFAYFLKHKGKLKIGIGSVPIDHKHEGNMAYQEYRNEAVNYVKKFMRENNIKRRIDLGGGEIKV